MINRQMYANEQGHKSDKLNKRVGKILGYDNFPMGKTNIYCLNSL